MPYRERVAGHPRLTERLSQPVHHGRISRGNTLPQEHAKPAVPTLQEVACDEVANAMVIDVDRDHSLHPNVRGPQQHGRDLPLRHDLLHLSRNEYHPHAHHAAVATTRIQHALKGRKWIRGREGIDGNRNIRIDFVHTPNSLLKTHPQALVKPRHQDLNRFDPRLHLGAGYRAYEGPAASLPDQNALLREQPHGPVGRGHTHAQEFAGLFGRDISFAGRQTSPTKILFELARRFLNSILKTIAELVTVHTNLPTYNRTRNLP